jgi:hypothetical protein
MVFPPESDEARQIVDSSLKRVVRVMLSGDFDAVSICADRDSTEHGTLHSCAVVRDGGYDFSLPVLHQAGIWACLAETPMAAGLPSTARVEKCSLHLRLIWQAWPQGADGRME